MEDVSWLLLFLSDSRDSMIYHINKKRGCGLCMCMGFSVGERAGFLVTLLVHARSWPEGRCSVPMCSINKEDQNHFLWSVLLVYTGVCSLLQFDYGSQAEEAVGP